MWYTNPAHHEFSDRFVLLGERNDFGRILVDLGRVRSGARFDERSDPARRSDSIVLFVSDEIGEDLVGEGREEFCWIKRSTTDVHCDVLRDIHSLVILSDCSDRGER